MSGGAARVQSTGHDRRGPCSTWPTACRHGAVAALAARPLQSARCRGHHGIPGRRKPGPI